MVIALVDDNEEERLKTLPLLMDGFKRTGVPVARFDFFTSGEEFLEHWKLGSYDLIVLDIVMGEVNGIDVAREIRKNSPDVRIVFCSSSNEYACESYDVNASYYMQKPVNEQRVEEMIKRLNIIDFELRRFIVLPDGQHVILRNIIFAEYSNHLIEIYTKQGEPIKTWMSLKHFSELIKEFPYFVTCNKGTIVNLHEVTKCQSDAFTMTDGSVIPISRRKASEMEQSYKHFIFSSIRKG